MIVYSILFENINVELQMKKDVRESFAQPENFCHNNEEGGLF